MRSRRWKRCSESTASRDWMIAFLYWGTAMAARMPMMATTVMSSMRVKPRAEPRSPGVVARSIEALRRALRVDVPHVLAAPGRVLRLVLVASHTPLGGPGHGVDRDAPQELDLAVYRPHPVHALHQGVQVGRVALAAELHVAPPDLP